MKKLIFMLITLFILTPVIVSAETFTQANRFQYFLYRNSDSPLTSGTGLIDSYGGTGYNRVQFLYNLYTFDSSYLYDITFTTYYNGTGGTGVLTADNWAQSCSIYTGSGSQYNCSYTGGYDNNNQVYMRSSITNMVGTDLNTLWLNFYSSGVSAVNLLQTSYKLEINRKENKNVTSENIQNATDSIINNNNQNTNSIINNQNENNNALRSDINAGVDHILDSQNSINNSINSSAVDNPSNAFDSFNNSLPTNNTISSLITLPVRLFQKVLNSLNGTCSSFSLGNLLGTDLTLPCINISSYIGNTLWNVIDILFSGFFIYTIARKMIKAFDSFSSMKEGDVLND